MSADNNTSKNLRDWGIGLLVVAVIIALIAIVASMMYGNTTVTTEDRGSKSTSSLSCASKAPVDGFFDLGGVTDATHEVKILFDDGKLQEMMYTLDAKYGEGAKMNVEQAEYSAKYDKYMEENSLDRDILAADFGRTDDSVKVKLHMEAKRFNNVTAKLFFMNPDDFANLSGKKSEEMKKLYEKKGFSCKYKE